MEEHQLDWRDDGTTVLTIDITTMRAVDAVARHPRTHYPPGQIRLYNIDHTPQYRYCLETSQAPTPTNEPTTLHLETTDKNIADSNINKLDVNETTYTGSETEIIKIVQCTLRDQDPDILILSHSNIIPRLTDKARHHIQNFRLGRRPGYTQLAQESTYEQYGKIGHGPARYKVTGRYRDPAHHSSRLDALPPLAGLRGRHRQQPPLPPPGHDRRPTSDKNHELTKH